MDAAGLIKKLGLTPLSIEGGYFLETYRSEEVIPAEALPPRYNGERQFSTAIYYLLTPDTFSHIHRLASDEIFHFYLGDPVEMLQLNPDGSHRVVILGSDVEQGHMLQVIVPRGMWQGCRLAPGGKYALMGTTVAPAFNYEDYENGNREDLVREFPDCADMIRALTKD